MLRLRAALPAIAAAAAAPLFFPSPPSVCTPASPAPAPAAVPSASAAAASAASRLAAVAAAAAALRGPQPFPYPPIDPTGTSSLTIPLPNGAPPLVIPPPVRPLPSATGDIEADFEARVRQLQDEICGAVAALEGGGSGVGFREDVWTRPEGGGGRSRVLQGGAVFEKAGVNVSTVHGLLPPAAVAMMRSRPGKAAALGLPSGGGGGGGGGGGAGAPPPHLPFCACGISLVLHPVNPLAPTVHANYRLFRVAVAPGRWVWWYGGGADLTPSYPLPEDGARFHGALRAACDRAHPTLFARLKAWADAYFSIPHRGGERRGIGGIFFDDLDCGNLGGLTAEGDGGGGAPAGEPHALLPFVADAARSFLHAYAPVLAARARSPFTAEQKEWQQLRRGRYAEFNLVHDRGTKFGLATPGARIESVLMSLPLTARWEYMRAGAPGSPEAAAEGVLKEPVDWVEEKSSS